MEGVGMLPLSILLTPLPLFLILLPLLPLLSLLPSDLSYFFSISPSFLSLLLPNSTLILLFILPPSVPSTISMDEVQVTNNVITWRPPTEPNGIIRYYNIRISQNGTGFVREVTQVMETRYDFSTLGLSAGAYMVQVSLLCVCAE